MRHFALFLAAMVVPFAQGQPRPPGEVLNQYLTMKQAAAERVEQVIEVEIYASISRLKKQGRMTGFKLITRAGGVAYRSLRFSGDVIIKTAVIARYLSAETQAAGNPEGLEISPANYRFAARGTTVYGDRTAYVYRVEPRRKKVGLFKGEVWLDSETSTPLREWGKFVKSPSIFIKGVTFVHDYVLTEGRGTPRRLILSARTILVGKVDMTVWYCPGTPESEVGSYLGGEPQ